MTGFRKSLLLALTASLWVNGARAATPEETIAKIEHDFAEMQVTGDKAEIDRVAAVMSDDFFFFNPANGVKATKDQLIASIKTGRAVVSTMDFPPFLIHVFGSTAIAQGTNDSTGLVDGKTNDGAYTWFDVFEKRGDRWVWIVSESSKAGAEVKAKIICVKAPCETNAPGFSLKR
jgi:ketosteroid isomerase-like protein